MDDGDGRENITFKMIPCFFKLCRAYSNSLKMSNVGNFPGVDFLWATLKFRERKLNPPSLVYVPHKIWNYAFSRRRSRSGTTKKYTKKRDVRAKLFAHLNLLLIWRPRCRRRRRCQSSLLIKRKTSLYDSKLIIALALTRLAIYL